VKAPEDSGVILPCSVVRSIRALTASLTLFGCGCWLAFATSPLAADEGMVPIFDGESLAGWDGDPEFWRVENGAIVGQTTPDNPTKGNTFLIWRAGLLDDFVLELDYRLTGGNSGIQYRSRDEGGFVVGGYQADFEAGTKYSGILYDERGRGILCERGERVSITPDGTKKPGEPIGDSAALQDAIRPGEWNAYRIVAQGPKLQHFINGQLMSETIDHQAGKRVDQGILALQVHAGPPMKVEFRNVRLKRTRLTDGRKKLVLVAGTPTRSSSSPTAARAIRCSSGTAWPRSTPSRSEVWASPASTTPSRCPRRRAAPSSSTGSAVTSSRTGR